MTYLKIRNWDKWQTYRKDRGQPPWIKIHRCLMRNPEWVSMTDAERGQLVAIWLLGADHNGVIPASPEIIQKLCFLDRPPNIKRFIDLNWIEYVGCHDGVMMASSGCQHDQPKAEAETEKNRIDSCPELSRSPGQQQDEIFILLPTNRKDYQHPVTRSDIRTWQELYPAVDVKQALRNMKGWLMSHPKNRKTKSGTPKFITSWLAGDQDRAKSFSQRNLKESSQDPGQQEPEKSKVITVEWAENRLKELRGKLDSVEVLIKNERDPYQMGRLESQQKSLNKAIDETLNLLGALKEKDRNK